MTQWVAPSSATLAFNFCKLSVPRLTPSCCEGAQARDQVGGGVAATGTHTLGLSGGGIHPHLTEQGGGTGQGHCAASGLTVCFKTIFCAI